MTGSLNLPVNGLVVGTNQLVASGGNVGIGTTNTQNVKLRIFGNSALNNNNALYWRNFADSGSVGVYSTPSDDLRIITGGSDNRLTILSGGNVGIGIMNPTAKLHIGGTSGIDGIKFPDGTTQTTAATTTGSITSGTYTGDSVQNRALAHSLTRKPMSIRINNAEIYAIYDMTKFVYVDSTAITLITQTNADPTYFYVGGPAPNFLGNYTGIVYNWVLGGEIG